MATYLIGNIKGPKGADGVSPTANVEQVANGAVITITDASGTTTALVRNGVDGDGNNIDLTPYATWTGMDAAIDEIKDDYATKDELEDAISNVSVPVTSVNGLVGDVVIPAPDLTGYATQTWVNSQNFLQQAPVSSVNAKTGDVVLTATDVGALPNSTTIPTKTSDLTNDSNFVNQNTMTTWLATKQDVLTAGANIDITNGVISATGGSSFSGDYDDLTNKPDLSVYAESADLATVATTGDYDDLTNKPTIPTVPTAVSSFTNDAGYITSSDLPADELPVIASGDAGKVLSVNSAETGVEWTTVQSGGSGGEFDENVYSIEGNEWSSVPSDLVSLFQNDKKPHLIISKDTSTNNRDVIYTFAGSAADHNVFSNTWIIWYTSPKYENKYYSLEFNKPSGRSWTVTKELKTDYDVPAGTTTGQVLTFKHWGAVAWETPSAGTVYSAGTGIDITNDVISVDNTVALKTDIPTYTAGANIDITNGEISLVDDVVIESEPDQSTGEYNSAEMNVEAGFVASHYDGTNSDPVNVSWLDSGSVGVTENTYFIDDKTGDTTVSTNSVTVEPTGIHIQKGDEGVDANIAVDHDNLTWDGNVILTESNVDDYVSGGGSSYTDADVYNAIQTKFGMSSSATINWDMIGQNNGDSGRVVFNMTTPINQAYTYYKVSANGQEKQFHTTEDREGQFYLEDDEDNETITWEEVGTDDYMWTFNYDTSFWGEGEYSFELYGGMDGTSYSPLYSNFMPWNELDQRYSSGGGGSSSIYSDGLISIGNGYDEVLGARIETYTDGSGSGSGETITSYTPINSNFMPWDELDSRYSSGGGSFTPEGNDLLTWSGNAASTVLGANIQNGSISTRIWPEESDLEVNYTNYSTSDLPVQLPSNVVSRIIQGTAEWKAMLSDGAIFVTLTADGFMDLEGDASGTIYTYSNQDEGISLSIRLDRPANAESPGDFTLTLVSVSTVNGWDGNGSFTVKFEGTEYTTQYNPINTDFMPIDNETITVNGSRISATNVLLTAPNGNVYKLSVDNNGNLSAVLQQ